MTFRSTKEHFAEYRKVQFQIQDIRYRYDEIWAKLTNTSSWNADKVLAGRTRPRASTIKDQIPIELYEELDTLEKQLDELSQRKQELYTKHLEEIALVDDEKSQRILRLYYLFGKSCKDIAGIMDITESSVKRLKVGADKRFSKVIESSHRL